VAARVQRHLSRLRRPPWNTSNVRRSGRACKSAALGAALLRAHMRLARHDETPIPR